MIVLAVGCHPDDIEFMMGGTLLHFKDGGCALHYLNIANGSCGTARHEKAEIVRIRREEARRAAEILGAEYHESLADDLNVYFTRPLVGKVAAVMRQVQPDVVLTLSLEDYMEDHMAAARIAVTAAFVRGMRNFETDPPTPPFAKNVAIYHALPYGLREMMGREVEAEFFVDVGGVIERKVELLGKHESQRDWLDKSQGLGSYLATMREMARTVGKKSGKFDYAEGWRRHNPLGYGPAGADPLRRKLAGLCEPPGPALR